MSNGDDPLIVNCILGICCPENSEAQTNALASLLVADMNCPHEEARLYAGWMLHHFDLAEKGTLTDFKASITKLARGPKHKA